MVQKQNGLGVDSLLKYYVADWHKHLT